MARSSAETAYRTANDDDSDEAASTRECGDQHLLSATNESSPSLEKMKQQPAISPVISKETDDGDEDLNPCVLMSDASSFVESREPSSGQLEELIEEPSPTTTTSAEAAPVTEPQNVASEAATAPQALGSISELPPQTATSALETTEPNSNGSYKRERRKRGLDRALSARGGENDQRQQHAYSSYRGREDFSPKTKRSDVEQAPTSYNVFRQSGQGLLTKSSSVRRRSTMSDNIQFRGSACGGQSIRGPQLVEQKGEGTGSTLSVHSAMEDEYEYYYGKGAAESLTESASIHKLPQQYRVQTQRRDSAAAVHKRRSLMNDFRSSVVALGEDSDSNEHRSTATTPGPSCPPCCCNVCSSCWTRFRSKWKRTYQLIFQVLFPMFGLIVLSLICGYGMSVLESPAEFDHNDEVLREHFRLEMARVVYQNITMNLPKACILAYTYQLNLTSLVHNVTQTSDIFLNAIDVPYFAKSAEEISSVVALSNMLREVDLVDLHDQVDNVTDLFAFTNECTVQIQPAVTKMYQVTVDLAQDEVNEEVRLDWSRCPDRTVDLNVQGEFSNRFFSPMAFDLYDRDIQILHYKQIYFTSLEKHVDDYLRKKAEEGGLDFSNPVAATPENDSTDLEHALPDIYDNYTTAPPSGDISKEELHQEFWVGNSLQLNGTDVRHIMLRIEAYAAASKLATGRTGCYENIPAAAWFWFTIMTTIGYGNATARSTEGRALVFTLGFMSILVFAAVTARAGKIISKFFDQDAKRLENTQDLDDAFGPFSFLSCRIGRFLSKIGWVLVNFPVVALCVRAVLYYLWVLVIAQHYVNWQRFRMDNTSVGMNDGYWFGYISTTTVGLGDFPLQPQVITYSDLITFPLLFLIGFVLLASFLDKLSEVLGQVAKETGETVAKSTKIASVMLKNASATFLATVGAMDFSEDHSSCSSVGAKGKKMLDESSSEGEDDEEVVFSHHEDDVDRTRVGGNSSLLLLYASDDPSEAMTRLERSGSLDGIDTIKEEMNVSYIFDNSERNSI